MTLWFFSDPHFGHENIIKYCNRPFKDAAEMDEAIIERVNALVKPQDHLYCLGDVAMSRQAIQTASRLNGHKRLIFGNHDVYDYKEYAKAGFKKLMAYRVIDGIMFSHIPIHPASFGRFRANVHGHIHNNQGTDYDPRWYINLSVEKTDYKPVPLDWIQTIVKSQEDTGERLVRLKMGQGYSDPMF